MAIRLLAALFLLQVGTSLFAQVQVQQIQLDTLGQKVITDFLIEGNKLTKKRIIYRELSIHAGDTLYWSNLQAGINQSKNNLMNTGLFNFVNMEAIMVDNEHVIVSISLQERWYLYPVPILEIAETNFNTWWEKKELRWLNYGLSLSHKNFRGLNQTIGVTMRFGYTKKFSFRYAFPNLNKSQTLGLDLSAGYFENNQIVYNTVNNERLFYENSEQKARSYYHYKVSLSYRENIFTRHFLDLSMFDASVQDSVILLQPEYFDETEPKTRFLRLNYILDHDTRDYKRYPLQGLLMYGVLQQDGLGILNRKGFSLFTTYASFRQYMKTGKRTYFSYSLTGKVNWDDNPPYYLLSGLGYSDFVRGYEFYVIDGTRYGLVQTNFKYEIVKPRTIHLPFIPSEKFNKTFVALYGNIFADAGYVYGKEYENRNSLVNEYIYSVGVGLDLVTYYDKVVRAEVSLNGLGETGFYMHFKQAF